MQVTGLCFILDVFVILLLDAHILDSHAQSSEAGVRLVTNKQQFFEYENITFHCDGLTQWGRIRTRKKIIEACAKLNRACTIEGAFEFDTGEYWCETDTEKSNIVNITVTGGSVILESPASPVEEGSNVTLRCRNRSNTSPAKFYKDGMLLEGHDADEMTILNMSKSDGGLYKCSISEGVTSPESWLTLREHHQPSHLPYLLITVLTFISVSLVLLVIGCIFLMRQKDAADAGGKFRPCFRLNHSRKQQRYRDEDDASYEVTYSTLTVHKEKQAHRIGSEPSGATAANGSDVPEQEVIYSAVHRVQKSETSD